MKRVFITDYFNESSIEESILGSEVTLEYNENIEILLVWHQKVNQEYLQRFPKLKGIQRYGVGFDCLDLDAIKKLGIPTCNNPDYGTDEVADTAISMIMAFSRGIIRYNTLSKSLTDTWQENVLPYIRRTNTMKIGIIGAGRIGGSVALKCKALGFNVVIYDKYKERGHEKMLGVQRVESIEELLACSDIITIHTPLTTETAGMVDDNFLSSMKKGSSLVLTARGGILNSLDSIYEALEKGHIENIGLDVLPSEPPHDCKLIQAWRNSEPFLNSRLIINNHTSFYSRESFEEIRIKAAQNAFRMLNNLKPYNLISY